jgi:hypothetical protein
MREKVSFSGETSPVSSTGGDLTEIFGRFVLLVLVPEKAGFVAEVYAVA